MSVLTAGCHRQRKPAPKAEAAQPAVRFEPTLLTVENRPVYPYSIVPGGVGSRQDIERAVDRDPLVAEHYAGLDTRNLKQTKLEKDTAAYVSFRMNGKVYWTSKKVKLSAGETVFLGSDKGVRGRCGNQVSSTPQGPVLPNPQRDEPTSEAFTTPVTVPVSDQEVHTVLAERPVAAGPTALGENVGTPTPGVSNNIWAAPAGGGSGSGGGVVAVAGGGGGSASGGTASTPVGTVQTGGGSVSTGSESSAGATVGSTVSVGNTQYPVTPTAMQIVTTSQLGQSVFTTSSYGSNQGSTNTVATQSGLTTQSSVTSNSSTTNNTTNNSTTNYTSQQQQQQQQQQMQTLQQNCIDETVYTPEPSTWGMGLFGLILVGVGAARQKRQQGQ
jgi:hypothetical protein